MLRTVRRVLAVVFFTALTLLFLDFTGVLHPYLAWMARVQLLPALLAANVVVVLVLLLLTLIFGRLYCSVVCPLGVLQDVIAWIPKRWRRWPYRSSREKRWLRYSVFVGFVVCVVLGIHTVVALLAPYSTYGRIATNLLQPLYLWGNNALAYIAERADSYAFYHVDVWLRSVASVAVAAATLLLLAVLAWRNGRTWCNTICPVGTLLSFFARFSLLKIHFDDERCVACGACARHCKAGCLDVAQRSVDYSRCVVCGNCLTKCKKQALHYGIPTRRLTLAAPTGGDSVDKSRRAFLLGTALATTTALLAQEQKTVDGGLAAIEDKVAPVRHTPLTPPGARSARHLQQHCTACQLCVAACPNAVLRPSTSLNTFMQPTMSYERGCCEPTCTRCSTVCPTGAILPLSVEEKVSTQIGHAVWLAANCVVPRDKVQCYVCSTHCPTGAITLVPLPSDDSGKNLRTPAIDVAKCIGCGTCEYLCTARPLSAIYVEGHTLHKQI